MVKWVKKEGKNENPTLQEASSSSLVKHGLHHERHAPSCNLGKSFFAPWFLLSVRDKHYWENLREQQSSLRKRKKKKS
jgi:hypothetical protein